MEIIILHSKEEEVVKFCEELIQVLGDQHGSTVLLPIEGHVNSVEVSQELETRRGSFLLLVLDEKLTEILEHKKSRKLFTKISSYVQDKCYVFVKHNVSEETWTELRDDLDLQNPSFITCEEQTVRQIAEAVLQSLPRGESAANKIATESDEADVRDESLGQCRLESSQWSQLNPASFVSISCENGSLPTRGQPEGTSQSPTDQTGTNNEGECNDRGSSQCDSVFITCSLNEEGPCDSTQLAVSGQSPREPDDEISLKKAEIKQQEELLASSTTHSSANESEQGVGETFRAESCEEENISIAADTTESSTTSLPLPAGQHIQMHFNNIPNLNVLCGGTLDNNSVGTQIGSPASAASVGYQERNESRYLSSGALQSPVLPFSLDSLQISNMPRLSASQIAVHNSNSIPRSFDHSEQSEPQTDVTSYIRQGSFQHPWNSSYSVTEHPGMCPQCHQYRDNIIHFFGREGFDLHSCSSLSRSGPEALSYMCNECLASIPQWGNGQRRTVPQEQASNYARVPLQSIHQSIKTVPCQFRQMSPQNVPQRNPPYPYPNQPRLPNIPNEEKKLLNKSFNGRAVERQYTHVMERQPHSAPPYPRQNMGFTVPQHRPANVNMNNLAMANFRPQILLMDQRMRNAGQQQVQYNIQVNNSESTNSDNTSDSTPSTFNSNKANQSPVKQAYRLQPINDLPPHPGQDDIGPSGGASVMSVTHYDPGGASAADSSGDIQLMDLSQEVMECIQNNMDYSSSQYNWERLATLHGWSFGKIFQLRQRWKQRQIDSPFLELLGREEFQNYTLRQLREDLNKIPRKDILEKLKMYEERGELTPTKFSK